ncbi:MAG TPA: Crp/Fnr family transcriptional regulator [Eudoraea sp.]|nr:Crp/Fnr family transcriptional regulator [Eudoraea sp.]
MNIQPIITHFANYLPLDLKDREALESRVHERKVKRRQFILQEGDVCRHYTFVVHGCFKMFKMDEKGQEHNLQFAVENDWIMDIGSFHSEKPSALYIEAMEQSVILQIARPNLLFLYVNHATFDRNFRVIMENAFVDLQKRILQNISYTAEERYLAFLEQHPELHNLIFNVQIASYIGITPEFLSKIRKTLASR